jgi:hypothetical protein
MNKVFVLLTDDEIKGAPAWALRDEVKRLTAEILRLRELHAAQQNAQSDKCPACDGKGWFGSQ